jgi:hypothetical protein
MIDFANDLRHRCRNPKCRMKLPAPVSNPREAFCCPGCHKSFYLHRCLVCECPIGRKREDQKICRKSKCRSAWRARQGFGRYVVSSAAKLASEGPDFPRSKQPNELDRAWRIVAGPPLTPSQLHCALVGAGEAVEAARRSNARYWPEANAAEVPCLIKRDSAPVNVTGGHRFPDAPAVDLRPTKPVVTKPHAVVTGDALDIPGFLRRPASMPADSQGQDLSSPKSKTLSIGGRPRHSPEINAATRAAVSLSEKRAPQERRRARVKSRVVYSN